MKKLLTVCCLFLFALPAIADENDAKAYVQKAVSDVFAIVKDSSIDDKAKQTQLESLFMNHVDTKWMGQFVLGRFLRGQGAEVTSRFQTLYGDFLRMSYVPKFRQYNGGDVEIQRVNASGSNEYTVQTLLKNRGQGQPDIVVSYRLLQTGKAYKIIDIIGEGVSLITTQRTDFGSAVSQRGLDVFLDMLDKKVASLKNKTA
jgi:phospholipid transport system substrate-binding protein